MTASHYIGSAHVILLLTVVTYILYSLWNNSHFSRVKWILLIQFTLLNICEVLYLFNLDKKRDLKNCNHFHIMCSGIIGELYYTIIMMIAWSTQYFFRQIIRFVQDGVLPKESTRKRINCVMLSIWFINFL